MVITGMGLSTSLGPDLPACWRRLIAGENGIAPISFWDPAEYSTKVAAEARHIPRESGLSGFPGNWCRRTVRLFLPPAAEAVRDAGLHRAPIDAARIGVSIGTSVNYLDVNLLKEYFRMRTPDHKRLDMARFAREGLQPQNGFVRRLGDTIASTTARLFGLGGPASVNDTACAASAHAIGEAFRTIRRGEATAMLAGGSTALVSPISILAFALLGALSRSDNPDEASRPFDRMRDGFVMGEGAGAVILESLESALSRGARIHAELTGFGSTLNAGTLTDPSPDGVPEARAMQLALADGGTAMDEIDYIAAHGTSTPKNDPGETAAIKRVFGGHARRLMVSSNKGQIGHTISAAGVCNLIFAVQSMKHDCVPPTMHLHHADPECDLDYVPNQSRSAQVRAALVNAFAFGGQNASLAVRRWSEA